MVVDFLLYLLKFGALLAAGAVALKLAAIGFGMLRDRATR